MDSTSVIVSAIQDACTNLGVAVPDDDAARHVIGLGLDEALRCAVPDIPEAKRPELAEAYRRHFIAQSDSIPLYDGAKQTIAELHGAGYFLAVATGKSRAGLERVLNASGLKDFFHSTRTADATVSKPDPAMLLELMDELAVDSERTLMVGDTTHDLLMAQNAGVNAVAMLHGAHSQELLQALKPLAMVEDFAALRAWLKVNA